MGQMKKGFITCIVSLLFTTITFAASAIVDGIEWHYTVEDGNATIEHADDSGSGIPAISLDTSGAITIPVTLDGYPVVTIGKVAFRGCSGLTVTIPSSVTSIGELAFYDCSSLTNITIPGGVISIGERAFFACPGLTSITIHEGVTSIGKDAFAFCSGLTNITIPESVTSIGAGAFSECLGLTNIDVAEENRIYISVDGILFDKAMSHVIKCPEGKVGSVVIPEGVTAIGEHAFSDCSGLTSITIPASVTSIGEWAFYNCSSLTSVTIPESVTSIGENAFTFCSGLTSIDVSKENRIYISVDGILFDKAMSHVIKCPEGKVGAL